MACPIAGAQFLAIRLVASANILPCAHNGACYLQIVSESVALSRWTCNL